MLNLDQLKLTFFEECSELLPQIEGGLADVRDGKGTAETINTVYRGVHSVKGGAGIFGFEPLVEFGVVFEAVLGAIRGGHQTASPDVLVVLFAACAILSDLVRMLQSGEAIPPGFGNDCRLALQKLVVEPDQRPEAQENPARQVQSRRSGR
jgi:two-component system chemotaxis sensor kinase CheA